MLHVAKYKPESPPNTGTVYVPILGKIRNYNLANTFSVVPVHASMRAWIYDGIK
ncbi:MAG: hypothetical protein OEW04_04215 [Nitrospirota bacterium]|nr:hypothetical protein [Nitrospirota bacterium]